jgi:4-amino-4-deoxy-L-arabinose transferase-like glycosyltransferase
MRAPRLKRKNKSDEQREQRVENGFWKRSLVERELFVVCLLVFGASMTSIISSEDAIHFALTWSLATSRSILLDASVFSGQLYTVQMGGHVYSALPPGLAFFTFGVVSLAQMITPMDPSASGVYIATYFSTIFASLAAVLFFKTARMFGSERASAYLTLVFAFGTGLWIYSRIYLPEALATLLSLASVYCLLKARQYCIVGEREQQEEAAPANNERFSGKLIPARMANLTIPLLTCLSGIFLGLATFVDNVAFFLVFPAYLYLLFVIWPPQLSTKLASLSSFILGALVGFVPVFAYDFLTTGNVLAAPYGNPFIGGVQPSSYTFNLGQGLYEMLISPSSGLIIFTPFVLVSMAALYFYGREKLGESLFFVGLFISILLPVSLVSNSTYFVHNTVGPAELVLGVPYILIPGMTLLTRTKQIGLRYILMYISGLVSILTTGIIALTDPTVGPAGVLSGASGPSPLISTNIPLLLDHSFLTWWSFFSYSILYAILIVVFPLILFSYWAFVGAKITGRIRRKDVHVVLVPVEAQIGRLYRRLRGENRAVQ